MVGKVIGHLVLGVLLAVGALQARDHFHIGAPALTYDCPAGSYVKTWWVPDSSTEGEGAPGTLEYHGWREIAACASSIDVGGNSSPG